ncbi:MAG: GNAT family N-acetyltransferase [Thermoplasmata archaeon]|uniref:GNAT family N-acetyltransferase n=1 Tax=Candidatus Sysuiplasma superficiale TaxID=2823368 RepID=A0A8J7YZ53_9ARCH|nr:GNAT family N-acetyltransferase [Candidatus Sysuiplasma superficiale]MBX8645036.1 GNAT family N-acetyltransferase [Candidatus Sysuiplasma superficiale]
MTEIRLFLKGDEKACSSLLDEAFGWYFRLPGSQWMRRKISAESILETSKDGITLVAVELGRIEGYAHAAISDYGVAYLSTIGVSPSSESKGIGTMLLKGLEERCRQKGIRKIWLMVTHINSRAVSFYIRNGYEIEGLLKDMTVEGAHEIVMSKHL